MNKKQNQKIDTLAQEILLHKQAYYSGNPIISDPEYDRKEEELKKLCPNHPVLNTVGHLVSEKKIEHQHPMLSLQKTYEPEELERWAKSEKIVGTYKIDGNSLSVIYKNGRFVQAKTRGDGYYGEDVTEKIIWSPQIPKVISCLDDLEIRGELYCSDSDFARLSEEMQKLGLPQPTNPRNIVAGVLGRKNYYELARFFSFFVFDVIKENHGKDYTDEHQKLEWLEKLGFTAPQHKLLNKISELKEYIDQIQQKLDDLEFAVDGVVFTYNNLDLHSELGQTSHHPRYKMVFKWAGDTATSTIESIFWSPSRLGIITPVAIIKPVYLSGANITNVSLHNALYVKNFNLKPGDQIKIIRSGEVIPKFLEVISSEENKNHEFPQLCPSCSESLDFDGVRLICTNSVQCPAQKMGRVLNWIRQVGIDDLSEKRLEQMFAQNLVADIDDLYKLDIETLLTLPQTKEKLAKKIYNNIQATKNTLKLSQFLSGFGIHGMGVSSWNKIIQTYNSLDKIQRLKLEDITQIHGFAEKTAQQIINGITHANALIFRLKNLGVEPIQTASLQTSQNLGELAKALAGKSIAITGSLSKPRKEIEDILRSIGANPTSSVSSKTYVLICNEQDSSSSKFKTAKELGINIWSEEELWKNLNL